MAGVNLLTTRTQVGINSMVSLCIFLLSVASAQWSVFLWSVVSIVEEEDGLLKKSFWWNKKFFVSLTFVLGVPLGGKEFDY